MLGGPRILIVGAGIAGLTLATALERHGILPTIIEIRQATLSRGLALMLTSNVAVALRTIGLGDAIAARGVVLESIVQTTAAGEPLAEFDLRPANAKYAPNLGVSRDALIAGLTEGLRTPIRYETTVVALERLEDSVRINFSDGTTNEFDLLVGADGLHSTVRKLIFPQIEPFYRSFCGWRTVMEFSGGDRALSIRSAPGRTLGSFQVASDLVYAFMLAHYPELPSLSRQAHLQHLKELAAQFDGPVAALIQQQRDPDRIVFAPVREVETPSYALGRILLIGDAAHAFLPQLAQGAAMAIEDAVCLGTLLGASDDVDQVLEVYEARRWPRVESIRAAVRLRAALAGMEGRATPELLAGRRSPFSNSLQVYEELIEDPFGAISA